MTEQHPPQQPPTQPGASPEPMPRIDERHGELEAARQYQAPYPHAPYYPQQVKAKSPGGALVASFFIPGLGSLIIGDAAPGLAIFACWCTAWVLLLTFAPLGVLAGTAVWVWAMWYAYTGAKKWNTRHGIVS
ncbi:MAG TPA: hypothetical protein VFB74_30650 [Kribbellaceae bacterium]|nr:hypothetical protein [Kribbellaceae bacterium]